LTWTGVPEGAKTLALLCEDPDAPGGTFIHGVVWNIPAEHDGLPKAIPTEAELGNGTRQGLNSARKVGYTGPCPPPGKPHHYHFTVYALDRSLTLSGQVTAAQWKAAMDGHVLAEGRITGLFER